MRLNQISTKNLFMVEAINWARDFYFHSRIPCQLIGFGNVPRSTIDSMIEQGQNVQLRSMDYVLSITANGFDDYTATLSEIL